jgi:hypothetical protein
MLRKKNWIIVGILLAGCIVISLFSANTELVEATYATHFYSKFSSILRILFAWAPFSIGDFLYAALVIYLLIKVFRLVKFLFRKNKNAITWQSINDFTIPILKKCCWIYILFNLFWGINYNRVGIASQLNLTINKYSLEELKNINEQLVEKINNAKKTLLQKNIAYPTTKELFISTEKAYKMLAEKYPFLQYKSASIKKSMWGWLGNYTGFLGYYNPITGEAQINTTVPTFTQPFTMCHEVAHQLGYAKEMEANFVGYLAAASSGDTLFRYSVYTDLFTYANRTLYIADSTSALQCRKKLLPEVIADYKERRKFYEAHRSFAEPIVRYIYGKFLEQNQQPMGILSYDEVTSFIIAYYKKFGII